MTDRITIRNRVRYAECDPMGFVHHSAYPIWFEMARTELLRRSGPAYAELERQGVFIVVVKLEVKYHQPARYDDVVEVTAKLRRSAGVRIEHDYEVSREGQRLVTGATTLACINRDGRPIAVPDALVYEPGR